MVISLQDKYHMTKEDNIFFAKRKLIDSIYQSANLEGIAVTFAETAYFLNNINTGRLPVDDFYKLCGLRDAWSFVLKTIDKPLTTAYIKYIHALICQGQGVYPLGDYRDRGVGISGTNWRPESPENCDYDAELAVIMANPHNLERCIDLFCWIQRSQMFLDGNKRVANLVANKEMIRCGQGIIAVPVEKIGDYFVRLIHYYETNDNTELKAWIYDNCLDGLSEDLTFSESRLKK